MLQIKCFCFNAFQENTYVLYNAKKEAIIIDPGCYFSAEKVQLKNWISEQGLTPTLFLNTHCHLDHVFGNNFISETYQLPVHIHAKFLAVKIMAYLFQRRVKPASIFH